MRHRFQAVFFANLAHIPATPEVSLDLMQRFQAAAMPLLPNVIQESGFAGMPLIQRLQFTDPHSGLQVLVGTGRLDVSLQAPRLDAQGWSTVEQFCQALNTTLNVLFHSSPVLGNRLACVIQEILPQGTVAEMETMRRALFKAPHDHEEGPSKEWSIRINTERSLDFGSLKEPVNLITKVE